MSLLGGTVHQVKNRIGGVDQLKNILTVKRGNEGSTKCLVEILGYLVTHQFGLLDLVTQCLSLLR